MGQSKWNFKSSGVVHGGKALWQKVPKAVFNEHKMPAAGSANAGKTVLHAPTNSATQPNGAYSFVNMKETANGFVAVGEAPKKVQVVMLLNKDGSLNKQAVCDNCGQLTGVAVSEDKTGIAVGGHCRCVRSNNSICRKLSSP